MTDNGEPMLVFDIETGPQELEELQKVVPPFDESKVPLGRATKPDTIKKTVEKAREAYWPDVQKRAALSAITGQVLAIGYNGARLAIDDRPERELLLRFWELYRKSESQSRSMVGHNLFGFDLPFIVRRSWIHGLAVPGSVIAKDRYWHPIFIDTMRVWQLGNYSDKFISLGDLGRALGLGGKSEDEVTGANFHEFWAAGGDKKQLACDYLKRDLELTWDVALRLGVRQ
jgi:hypothetical protein